MEMTEDLIRNVIQQVLSQMGTARARRPTARRSKPSGKDGVYPTADAAVLAAEAAFAKFRKRPLGLPARRPSSASATICVEQAEELGRMELEETKIGRLDHKIAKLRDAIPGSRASSTSGPTTGRATTGSP